MARRLTEDGADSLLWRWGLWSRHGLGVGYPRENIIARIMREGPGAGHNRGTTEISMPRDIEIAEAIINKFPKKIKRTIKMRYIGQTPTPEALKRLRCSREEFDARINYAISEIVLEFEDYQLLYAY